MELGCKREEDKEMKERGRGWSEQENGTEWRGRGQEKGRREKMGKLWLCFLSL